ncbi:ANTAR domain-containing protein [Streptomyces sp. NBC_00728]|uniref:ANTAR domain-containing protein n=1 Tax=Streptomyces sp. NBC_00728 TaxID=2903676 RepID=UPI00386AD682
MVDQAIGVVLAIGHLTPEQGWDVLREISQRTNIKLRHVSELIIDWARTGKLCTDVRTELERQLAQYTQPPQSETRGVPAAWSTGRDRSQTGHRERSPNASQSQLHANVGHFQSFVAPIGLLV